MKWRLNRIIRGFYSTDEETAAKMSLMRSFAHKAGKSQR